MKQKVKYASQYIREALCDVLRGLQHEPVEGVVQHLRKLSSPCLKLNNWICIENLCISQLIESIVVD